MNIKEGLVPTREFPNPLDSVVSVGHVPEGNLLKLLGAVGIPGPSVVVCSGRVENLVGPGLGVIITIVIIGNAFHHQQTYIKELFMN